MPQQTEAIFFSLDDLRGPRVRVEAPVVSTAPSFFSVKDLRVVPTDAGLRTDQSTDQSRRSVPRRYRRPAQRPGEHPVDWVVRRGRELVGGARRLWRGEQKQVENVPAAIFETPEEQVYTFLTNSYCIPRKRAKRENLIDKEIRHRDLGEKILPTPQPIKTDSAENTIPPIFDSKLEKKPTEQDLAEREYQVALPAAFRKYLPEIEDDEATEIQRAIPARAHKEIGRRVLEVPEIIWVGAREQQRILRRAILQETNPGGIFADRSDPLLGNVVAAEIQSYQELLKDQGRPGRAQRLEEAEEFILELHRRKLLSPNQVSGLGPSLLEKIVNGIDGTVGVPADFRDAGGFLTAEAEQFRSAVEGAMTDLHPTFVALDQARVSSPPDQPVDYGALLNQWRQDFALPDGQVKWRQLYTAARQILRCDAMITNDTSGRLRQLKDFLAFLDQSEVDIEDKITDFRAVLDASRKVRELLEQARPARKA